MLSYNYTPFKHSGTSQNGLCLSSRRHIFSFFTKFFPPSSNYEGLIVQNYMIFHGVKKKLFLSPAPFYKLKSLRDYFTLETYFEKTVKHLCWSFL